MFLVAIPVFHNINTPFYDALIISMDFGRIITPMRHFGG
jgi:hypothetical protein